jgi:4-hydroxy-3-polyprenylbenzoate decarboxylase
MFESNFPVEKLTISYHVLWNAFKKLAAEYSEDEQEVLFQMGANVDWRRDTVIVDGPVDILDHAAPYEGAGSKIGIDATRKLSSEGYAREWPSPVSMNKEIKERVTRRWKMYGL